MGDIAASVNRTLVHYDLPKLDIPTIRSFVGEGPGVLMTKSFHASGREAAPLQESLRLFLETYDAHLLETTILYPGVEETLKALSVYRKAVITNKPFHHAERILQHFDIRRHFEIILGHDSLPQTKPAPEPVWHVLSAMGGKCEEAILIGDANYDIECARNAGVACATALYGFQSREKLLALKSDYYLEQFSDLLSVLHSMTM